jgi:hypothetical protein
MTPGRFGVDWIAGVLAAKHIHASVPFTISDFLSWRILILPGCIVVGDLDIYYKVGWKLLVSLPN